MIARRSWKGTLSSILSGSASGSSEGAIMDLSKLPKLSDTPAPPPAEAAPASNARVDYGIQPREPGGAEAWISIAIGGILLFAFPNTWHWLLHYNSPVITDNATGNV